MRGVSRVPVSVALLTLGLVAAASAIAALALLLGLGERDPLDVSVKTIAERAGGSGAPGSGDPLAFEPGSSERFAERATLGTSHVIYEKSPDGVSGSAERTAEWRDEVEVAASAHGIDADLLEAIVFLESAGRAGVMADGTPGSATGLTQIIPSTATSLLGMQVDLARSLALTRQIARALAKERTEKVIELTRLRTEADERFDPAAALDGAARYLEIAEERFGSQELAVVSYHMGIGNLENVISEYTGQPTGAGRTRELVDAEGIDYARLFFDSSPQRHADAWELLASFGDDSSLYYWRVRASLGIMRLWREDPDELSRIADLATAKATLEELYHPRDETEIYEEPGDVADARANGDLAPLPRDPSLGFKVAGQMGELAPELDEDPELYRALRPEALAALTYLAAKVKAISGAGKPLKVTSTVRDRAYQELLIGINAEATDEYSLHTTGWSFDILRRYDNERQAEAFQFVLDRMRAHAMLDYAFEPAAIHVTVSNLARVLAE